MFIFTGSIITLEQENAHGSCCTFLPFLLTNQCWCYPFALLFIHVTSFPFIISKSNQWVSESVRPRSIVFQLALKKQATKEEKNRNRVMDAKLLPFKASAHTILYLDDLGKFPKLKSLKVLFRKTSGLQKWKSTCATSLGITRPVQELTSGQHREYHHVLPQAHTRQMFHEDDILLIMTYERKISKVIYSYLLISQQAC